MSARQHVTKRLLPGIALVLAIAGLTIAILRVAGQYMDEAANLLMWGLLVASGTLMFISYMRSPSSPPRL